MSITKNKPHRIKLVSQGQKSFPQGLVLRERELESLVLRLRIGEAHSAAPRLLAMAEAFRAIDRGESWDLNMSIISQLVSEETSLPLRRLMKQIRAAAKLGERGLDAAWRTTVTTFHLGLDCIPDPSDGERLYEQRLKQFKRAGQNQSPKRPAANSISGKKRQSSRRGGGRGA